MKNFIFFHLLKFPIITLLTYNMFAVSVLYFPSVNIKSFFWQWTPYSYKQALGFPNHLDKASLLNKSNRMLVLSILNKSIYKDFLDINFWNYKQIIEGMDRDNIKEFEKNFYKTLKLSKNNPTINLELRNYFINNYTKFSNEYRNKILKNFFN
jgi:hypothetical protein